MLTILTVLATVTVGEGSAEAAPGRPYTNPIKSQKGADPWLEYYNGNYYLITTSWTSELTVRKSPTLAGLATAPSVQVWSDGTPSRCCNIWAPEMHFLNGRWYIYYTAGQNVADYIPTQRMHVLESVGSDPMGPYVYKNRLHHSSSDGWLIDGSVLELNGRLYLMASANGGGTQNLVIAPMSNPYTVSGPFSTISTPTLSWERQGGTVNEGPEALYRDGRTYIIYSASGCWTPDYKLGQLTYNGGDPLAASSWVKKSTPVFQRNDAAGVYGPGHNGFFTSPDGTENWIVYHANDSAGDGCDNGRTTRAQRFTWNSDGTPNFGTPVALGTTLAGPSGETATTPTAYTLVNRNSGKCLDLAGGSSADGANVQQWTCNGGANQQWRVEDMGDDTSRLVNVATGKVLDTADCSTADGADLRQWSWLNNTCQRFRFVVTDTGGWVRLTNANSGKVADVADCGTADGVDVRQWSWLNNACQQWQLRPVG
ncbi:family 43 glycosylhydrolase [Allostreptomyces psammosilenae]|uniref:GH43 family beta-xylosidase n=1 Tax=Allostreptomyces psammosilenae TaxID=1892865 RepID=A0A852ZZD9_9ACTN|nr:family 43 glycosylhydrolase [Allostreptomyces psammosilenae]NYI07706.1 GH43 family beta-xylosidase [Allostreptomyces psammosilenae]